MSFTVPLYENNVFKNKYVTAGLHPEDFFWVPSNKVPLSPNGAIGLGEASFEVNCLGKLKPASIGRIKLYGLSGRGRGHGFVAPIQFDLSEKGPETKRKLACDKCDSEIPYRAFMEKNVGNYTLRFLAWQLNGKGLNQEKIRANVVYPASQTVVSMPSETS